MSQIRKLQPGGKLSYGTLQIDGKTTNDPDEIERWISSLNANNPTAAAINGIWADNIRNGNNIRINNSDNTIVVGNSGAEIYSNVPGANKRQLNIITTGKPTYGGNNFSTIYRNQVYNAGKYHINDSNSKESNKNKIKVGPINVNYDTIDGKKVYSISNPNNALIDPQIEAYLSFLGDEKWGETNSWDGTGPSSDVERILKAWYNQFDGDKNKAARDAINTALNELRDKTKSWDELSEQTRELLEYFNILGPNTTSNTGSSTQGTNYLDENGNVKQNAQNEKGQWGTYIGDGNNGTINGARYSTWNAGSLPYLVNSDRIKLFEGLDDSYLNSVLYNGRFYRSNEIDQNIPLQRIMEEVAYINNSATSPADAYEKLKEKINYTDYGDRLGNVALYDSDKHYFANKNINAFFKDHGISRAAILNATNAYEVPEGTNIYEIYDYSHNGTQPYGFRSPFYLIVGKDGELYLTDADSNGKQHRQWDTLSSDRFKFLNRGYGEVSGIYELYQYNGKKYGRFIRKDASGEDYHFAEDEYGNIYHLDKNGVPILLTKEFGQKILDGYGFSLRELQESKQQAKKQSNNSKENLSYSGGGFGGGGRKNGGKIKELPKKFQPGGILWETPTEISSVGEITDPSAKGANGYYVGKFGQFGDIKWKDLRPQDRNDIFAAGADVLSAISALVPEYGTLPAAALGLTSTGFLTASDIQNKLPLGKVIRNAGINVGLDAVSLLPFGLGEGAAAAKIGKTVAKVGHYLIPLLNGAGLYVASDAAMKVMRGEKLSTDDYRALAAGITSVLNIGHGVARRFSDASLTRSANKARVNVGNNPEVEAPVHQREVILSKNASNNAGKKTPIKLEEGEVNAVINAKPEDAAKTLRNTLEKTHKVAKTELPSDDTKLLKDWGFEVDVNHKKIRVTKKARQSEGSIKKVSESTQPQTATNKKKSSYIEALYRDSIHRNEVIDEAMRVTDAKGNAVNNPIRTEIDKLRENGDWGFMRERAYKRAQKRTGEVPVTWFGSRKRTTTNEESPKQQEKSVTEELTVEKKPQSQVSSPEPKEVTTTNTPIENSVKTGSEAVIKEKSVSPSKLKTLKVASMEQRARNLQRLQKSMNPLATLSRLEKSNSDKLFTNEEEFNAVLEAIMKSTRNRGGAKTVEKYNNAISEKVEALKEANRLYKQGGIIKGETGLEVPDELKKKWGFPSKPNINNYIPNEIDPGEVYETLPGHKTGWRYKNWDNSNYWGVVQPALSIVRYFSQKNGRNKGYEEQHKALDAGRVNRAFIDLPLVPTYSVVHQHMENALQQQMMNGIKPISSNLTNYYAAKLMQQSALNRELNNIVAQKSSYEQQANTQNQQINAQENQMNNEIAFENAKMQASINAGHHQLEAAKSIEEQASRDNLLYEIQQKLYQDQKTMMQSSIAERNMKNMREYEDELKRVFADEWNTWQTVDQSNYADFESYVQSVNPTKYNQNKAALEKFREEQNNNLIATSTKGRMNYPWLYGKVSGYYGPAGYRKGGRVNGTTRYTLDPDERIWIDNNKAAHAKSAKLSDATIKLLLRALK